MSEQRQRVRHEHHQRRAGVAFAVVQVTIVKAQHGDVADHDRVYIEVGRETRRAAAHVAHDLPHLVVESFFGLTNGLWGELAAGLHADANYAATARDPKREKRGRIVSGAASGARTDEWLREGHRLAKVVTNAVANRWGDGPDTPAGVRSRLLRDSSERIRSLLDCVDDETIAASIQAVRDLQQRWASTPPGGILRLSWPLARPNPTDTPTTRDR
jgi:hypothetical protein